MSLPARHKSKTKRGHGFLNRGVKALIAISLIIVISVVAYQMIDKDSPATSESPTRVLLVTNRGEITIELYGDMPVTSGNFRNLTESGVFDGTIFHRVVHGFVIQGGDASPKGINVPTIPDELPNKHSNVRGSVAMAKTSEPNSATSQFYINLADNTRLDSNYSVFGRVIEGLEVVDAIGDTPTDTNDRPLQDVALVSAELVG